MLVCDVLWRNLALKFGRHYYLESSTFLRSWNLSVQPIKTKLLAPPPCMQCTQDVSTHAHTLPAGNSVDAVKVELMTTHDTYVITYVSSSINVVFPVHATHMSPFHTQMLGIMYILFPRRCPATRQKRVTGVCGSSPPIDSVDRRVYRDCGRSGPTFGNRVLAREFRPWRNTDGLLGSRQTYGNIQSARTVHWFSVSVAPSWLRLL